MFKSFRNELDKSQVLGLEPQQRLSWNYQGVYTSEQVKNWLIEGMQIYTAPHRAEYLGAYNDIVDWLICNHGKGLLINGDCGVGKTIITTKIIPLYLYNAYHKVATVTDARTLKDVLDSRMVYKGIVVVDDVGTEGELSDFGNRRTLFSEMVDYAEKNGSLLIVSTNLSKDDLMAYGARTFDRLRSMCRRVEILGSSMRRE